ncbi:MAG: biosynthetic-type acetolactate synthase large subunit [Deltaproteobacteria bacterium]|nr:biosynthetic-type acetolactate synthase large subunit [Deltaproteobacteria bacterium]
MKLTGSKIFVESLRAEGVEVVFGYPGGAVLHLYDEIYRSKSPRHILCRHEQGGVHMADGYAKATGKPGVALVTSGPALTNAITGLATAYMDSIPLVVFSGQVPTHLIGNDAFQEADNLGLTRSCTKHNFLVRDVKDLAYTIKQAFHIATTGRPGPVLVDLPKDVTAATCEFTYPQSIKMKYYNPTMQGHPGQIKKAVAALLEARKPVLYIGGGVINANAAPEMTELAELMGAPVTPTLMGLGGFPGDHPLSLGMLGMHGRYATNMAVNSCDLLVAIGARFDDRVTGKLDEFSMNSKKIHIDIDPTSIRKNVHVEIPIVGDSKVVIQQMLDAMKSGGKFKGHPSKLKPWWNQIREWQDQHPLTYEQGPGDLSAMYVIDKIYEMTRGEAIVATDVGQHQMWTAQMYHFKNPRCNLTSGGLGTMGYGYPAAVGAQTAYPDKLVLAVVGDGGFVMTMQEVITAVENNLNVKACIINNRNLGMVRQWQQYFYDRRYSFIDLSVAPDFVKLAEAFGCVGLRASKAEEVVPVLEKAFSTPRPVIMDFQVAYEENVMPMVPSGAPLSKMLLV